MTPTSRIAEIEARAARYTVTGEANDAPATDDLRFLLAEVARLEGDRASLKLAADNAGVYAMRDREALARLEAELAEAKASLRVERLHYTGISAQVCAERDTANANAFHLEQKHNAVVAERDAALAREKKLREALGEIARYGFPSRTHGTREALCDVVDEWVTGARRSLAEGKGEDGDG